MLQTPKHPPLSRKAAGNRWNMVGRQRNNEDEEGGDNFSGTAWCMCNEKMDPSSTLDQEKLLSHQREGQRRILLPAFGPEVLLSDTPVRRSMPSNERCSSFKISFISRCLIIAAFLPWNFVAARQGWTFRGSPKSPQDASETESCCRAAVRCLSRFSG